MDDWLKAIDIIYDESFKKLYESNLLNKHSTSYKLIINIIKNFKPVSKYKHLFLKLDNPVNYNSRNLINLDDLYKDIKTKHNSVIEEFKKRFIN